MRSTMGIVFVIVGVAFLLGLALRRWYLLWVFAALAVLHAAWIVVTGQDTSEDSTATLLVLSAMFMYAPALGGGVVGVMLGRLVRTPRDTPSSSGRW